MKIFILQFIIAIILIFHPFNSVVNFIVCYTLLFVCCKYINILNPILWLLLSWNILFINAYSGIIEYDSSLSSSYAVLICIIFICIFLFGFFCSNYVFLLKRKTYEMIDTYISMRSYLKSNFPKTEKLTKYFAILSIIATIFLFIEIVVMYGGNILAPALLRELYTEREATIFSQLAGVLYFGGLFCIPAFMLFKNAKFRLWYLIGIFFFAFGSVLSAGRQMVFQLIISAALCYFLMKFYDIKVVFSKLHKYIFASFITIILGYFIFISAERNVNDYDNRTKAELMASQNNLTYSKDFVSIVNAMPQAVENFFIDYTFYFSHEIFLLSEFLEYNEVYWFNLKILRFSPFIERQVDRLGLFGQTQVERSKEFLMTYNARANIIKVGWPTTILPLLENMGYGGAFILVFFHGFYSFVVYNKTKLTPSFGFLNLSIANNIVIFNIISNSAFSETQILFYIIVSLILINKNI